MQCLRGLIIGLTEYISMDLFCKILYKGSAFQGRITTVLKGMWSHRVVWGLSAGQRMPVPSALEIFNKYPGNTTVREEKDKIMIK